MSELKLIPKFKIIKAFKEIVKFNLILKSSYKELFNNDYEKLLKDTENINIDKKGLENLIDCYENYQIIYNLLWIYDYDNIIYKKLLKLKDKLESRIDLFLENKIILNKKDFIFGIKKDVIIMFDIFRQGVVDKEIDE